MDQLAAASADSIIPKVNALIVNPLIILMFAVALVGFLWGVMEYVRKADDVEARATGARHMLWGVVGMTIMISTFAILRLVLNTFGLNNGDTKTNVEKIIGTSN